MLEYHRILECSMSDSDVVSPASACFSWPGAYCMNQICAVLPTDGRLALVDVYRVPKPGKLLLRDILRQ